MCLKIYLALNGAFLLKFVLWGVFNFALNPERVTGENKSNIRIQNFKRNRMDFLCFFPDFYLLRIRRYFHSNRGGSNIWEVRWRWVSVKQKIVKKWIDSIDRLVLTLEIPKRIFLFYNYFWILWTFTWTTYFCHVFWDVWHKFIYVAAKNARIGRLTSFMVVL
jgi:hypothetical protein